jgi:amino-acid N-acetyltransferase
MCSPVQVLACALLLELGASSDGVLCGELAAFCVHPSYRGAGRGDSLLDYVEQQARDKGIRRMVGSVQHVFVAFSTT